MFELKERKIRHFKGIDLQNKNKKEKKWKTEIIKIQNTLIEKESNSESE